MNVPSDLNALIGIKELRYSLKTGYVGDASQKARYLAGQFQLLFAQLRKGGAVLSDLTEDQIQKLVQQFIKEKVDFINGTNYDDDYRTPECRLNIDLTGGHFRPPACSDETIWDV